MTVAQPPPGDGAVADLLTRAEASEFLLRFGVRMKPSTLARLWSTGGSGPPCVHVRGKPLYPKAVLQNWAEAQSTGLRTSKKTVRPPGASS